MKTLTSKDIQNLTFGWHRCGYLVGAAHNPNPECGCMCGRHYDHDDECIISMYELNAP